MQKQKLILLGGGGHCKSCIDVIESTNKYEIVGILDNNLSKESEVLNYRVVGSDNEIVEYKKQGCQFLITVGQIKTPSVRKKIFRFLQENDVNVATIISSKAYVSPYAKIGVGTIVMHGVTVIAASRIGSNCILNTGCDIEHDAVIGDNTHISTHAVINGDCIIGDDVFVGSNATVSSGINIENNIIIGAGTVVKDDILNAGTYVGNPARKIN